MDLHKTKKEHFLHTMKWLTYGAYHIRGGSLTAILIQVSCC